MKYNPKLNDKAASFPDFQEHHPLAPCSSAPGILQLMWELQQFLAEISGFPAISLQPVAGAQGEFCGLLIMRKYHLDRGKPRTKVIIPDSSHGTNPASVAAVGFSTIEVKSNEQGIISPEAVQAVMSDDVAGVMMTNPNTLGLFEKNIVEIAKVVHKGGGLMYMDGANLNATMGIFRPGETDSILCISTCIKRFRPRTAAVDRGRAVGVTSELEKYLPLPTLTKDNHGKLFFDYDRPHSIGRLHGFNGNFANMVRAYAYIKTMAARD